MQRAWQTLRDFICSHGQAHSGLVGGGGGWGGGHLESPGFDLLGGIGLDHVQGLVQATGQAADVVPDPV